jgi:hypothetical protein
MIRARREDTRVIGLRTTALIGIALVAFLAGVCGALVRGFWGVSEDCHEWVDGHGYLLPHTDSWAKGRGCVGRTPAGDALYRSEEIRSKAIGWAWQFTIFTADTLPAITIVAITALRWRRSVGGDL